MVIKVKLEQVFIRALWFMTVGIIPRCVTCVQLSSWERTMGALKVAAQDK